ncbi:MAG: hypothetical protein U0R44_03985 [Candidatus Micrarchaeia archaeon]
MRALIPQPAYPPGAPPAQRRSLDAQYEAGLRLILSKATTGDRTGFDQAVRALDPTVTDTNPIWNRTRRLLYEDQMEEHAASGAVASASRDAVGVRRHMEGGFHCALGLTVEFRDIRAGRRFLDRWDTNIRENGKKNNTPQSEIDQQRADMYRAAMEVGFPVPSIVGSAMDNSMPQSFVSSLSVFAVERARSIMGEMRQIDTRLADERDAKRRREEELRLAELSSRLAVYMGGSGALPEGGAGRSVSISETAVTESVQTHVDLLVRMHSGDLRIRLEKVERTA